MDQRSQLLADYNAAVSAEVEGGVSLRAGKKAKAQIVINKSKYVP